MKVLAVILLGVLAVILIPFGFYGWHRWDSSKNRGFEFGYYGEFNRVSNALASIPGVSVTQAWHNLDLSLEWFSFGIMVTGQPLCLTFSETDQIRAMSRDAAITALKKRLATELSITNK